MTSTHEAEQGHEVRAATAADRQDLVRLYERCFGKSDGERVLAWRYDKSPCGQALSLVTCAGDRLVCGYACTPRLALSRGDEASAATIGETGDVMTDPEWRGRGLFSALDRRAMEEARRRGWPVVLGLPNRSSERLFVEKLGWKLVGHVKRWTFVLASDEGARAERMRAGRLAAAAVPWALWRGIVRRGRLRNRAFDRVNTLAIRRFDAAADALSKAVEPRFGLMVRRDHAWLNWRYVDAPSGLFRAHGVYESSGELVGWAIVQLPRRGERVGHVVDLVAQDDVAFAAAMDGALGHLQKAGASVARASAAVGSEWERRLVEAGFRAPKRDDRKAIIAHVLDPEHPLARASADPTTWHFTDGDRDDETVS